MGGSAYSVTSREMRSVDLGYKTAPIHETFSARNINSAMDPNGVGIRESCDSDDKPESLAIIIGLDVTGSMGSVPHFLVKQGLPDIMGSIIQKGIANPQVLFLGIGDHECDRSPLQVGQFEASDELLDKWLTDTYLEGGGGGNYGESYLLAWYFAAKHTSIDCFKKRNKKGLLFTIGDEPVLRDLPKRNLEAIMGPGQYGDCTAAELLEEASKTYDVYHIHVKWTGSGGRSEVIGDWRQLIGQNLLVAERPQDVAKIISEVVTGAKNGNDYKDVPRPKSEDDEDIML